jgi:23S rRNA pseudouridine2605 synthase
MQRRKKALFRKLNTALPAPRRQGARPLEAAAEVDQRLQKVMAAAGIGSRRKCEDLIRAGRVEVDGQVVTELGTRVDQRRQEIHVDGVALKRPKLVYYLVNKPPGVVSTSYDPAGRMRVIDLVPPGRERVYTVGRLDRSSEGLMLVTNDGELANQLTHPKFGVAKTYQVTVAGQPAPNDLQKLTSGVHLAEGVARAERVTVLGAHGQSTLLEIVLREGKNREIRRILARVGHKVLALKRVAIGPLKFKDLPVGAHRRLSIAEVEELRHSVARRRRPADAAEEQPDTKRVVYRRRAAAARARTKKSAPRKTRG